MNYAPTISSIISPKYLSGFVKLHYNLNATLTCSILKTGVNHTYLIISEEKKYVLRVYFLNWKTKKEIEAELDLLNNLKENGLSVSVAIKDKNNQYIQTINAAEGNRFAVLFTYAKGEIIRNPSEEICFKIGKTMAKFHQLTCNKSINRISYNAKTLVNTAYTSAEKFFNQNTEEMQFYKRANTFITTKFKKANTTYIRKGVIHLDFWYENMKITNSKKLTVFDFDNCGNGWQFLDISYYLMILFRNEPNKDLFKKKQLAFYSGYQTITSISSEEKKLIPLGGLAIWLHYNGIHIARFNDFANPFLSEEFLKYWINTVKQWLDFNSVKI